jgi:hypothetical protein
MKTLLLLLIVAVGTAASAQDTCARPGSDKTATKDKHLSPFACDREALDPVGRKRHFDELGPQLRDAIVGVRELPDGYEFQFSPNPATVAKVAEWAAGERLCCPFFNISLRMDPEHGPFWLRLTGRKGTKAFIQQDGAEWLQHARVKG